MEHAKRSLRAPGAVRRQPVSLSRAGLITAEPLDARRGLPLLIQPAVGGVELLSWAGSNRDFIESRLQRHGALLFRRFDVRAASGLEQFIRVVSGEALEYRERSSPRSRVSGNIYTSTDYPASQSIFLHNENSYQRVVNQKIFFCCETPPARGGETPIADCRRVYERISPRVRERFAAKGWMYTRNYGEGFGLPWPTAFQTSDRAAVEEHCRRNGIEAEWQSGGRLRTRAVLPAISRHPRTRELTWFNHAVFFHASTLEPALREGLLVEFKTEDDFPINTYYGDGSPIEPEVLDELRQAYRQETVSFPWERGDLLMVDNLLVAHGRAPFDGPRKILVGMSEPIGRQDLGAV
jgi:alpha-ketoglutarate-dependent taurine dioxygenase